MSTVAPSRALSTDVLEAHVPAASSPAVPLRPAEPPWARLAATLVAMVVAIVVWALAFAPEGEMPPAGGQPAAGAAAPASPAAPSR
ncbi:hypothetical protein [Conexibacter sp. SYSU D00693]|uniref:hypothetical protein n=1 Tax=Conexibacter sp. SYSU D00693 TaxID=2812560 RepID=UPI00196A66C1|nr:hypothetical protein [Conexibacter sp. SYSU D00693]